MYHKKTHPLVKETVEKGFCKLDGSVGVVFCTIAFGMGVNVEGAYIALHFLPSSCLDDYLQEVGTIGWSSDKQSHAVLLTYSGCTRSKNITNGMKEYVRNTDVCRRSLLMQPFLVVKTNWLKKPGWSVIHVVTYVQRRADVCACARVNAHVTMCATGNCFFHQWRLFQNTTV